MNNFFYIFEHGSGCTWGRYVVPASAYRVELNHKGQMSLTPVNFASSVSFHGIDKKSFRVRQAQTGFHADLEEVLQQEIVFGAVPS